jgi:hypothetical protein
VIVEVAERVAPFIKFPIEPISNGGVFSLTIPGGCNPVEVGRESVDDIVVVAAVVVGAAMRQ